MKYVILYKNRSVVKLPISETYDVTTHSSKPHTVVFVTLKGEFEATTSLRQIEGESESAGKLKGVIVNIWLMNQKSLDLIMLRE
ncbi:hypothetical protein [Streptococcus equi]|uniref:hypothetical protein n=1 Tax=Streptococcus equi TaxID=1336 RepID=UPI001E37E9D5|nr:hypothetical protein [Streptococcus equi]